MTQREAFLFERPKVIPVARTIFGERAQQRLKAYNEFVSQFSNRKARDVLGILSYNPETQDLEQSNLFTSIALSQIGTDKRTARLSDLTKTLTSEDGDAFFDGIYAIAPEVCLRSVGDSDAYNDLVARRLAKKLKIKRLSGTTLVIGGLALAEDERSPYGLFLVPTQSTIVTEAPALAYKGKDNFNFSEVDDSGIPIPREDGVKTCWIRKDGLSMFFVNWRDLFTDGRYLAFSDRYGRVVEMSAEGVAQNLDAYKA